VSRRVPYFERPKEPRDWRFWVGGLGKVLITLGLLMFAFVAYQLWGTGIQTSRSQDSLQGQFNNALQSTTTSSTTTTTTSTAPPHSVVSTSSTTSTTTTVPVALASNANDGDPIAQLEIPTIHLRWIVVQGVAYHDLKKGPGHFPETPLPGQLGNAAIAGHRTTYGAPFFDLDKLAPGDLIELTTLAGHYTYKVTGSEVVRPDQYADVIPTRDHTKATLTLSTCTPVSISSHRLIVHAELVTKTSGQVYRPPTNTTIAHTTTTSATLPGESAPTTTAATGAGGVATTTVSTSANPSDTTSGNTDAFSQGWFSDGSAILPSILWGLALLAVTVGAYFVGKRYRRLWVCFAVGFAPFIVVLYFFFENVNRLLPPGL
jgi:sortase A